MKGTTKYYIIILFIIIFVYSCIEPYQLETNTFEDVLVVECTIDNEMKNQKINLSRVFKLEENEPSTEKNALVRIEDSNQNVYNFSENELGVYLSDSEFKAFPNVGYTLFVTTSDGKKYESSEEFLTAESIIDNLYPEKSIVNSEQGVQVYVDSNGDLGPAKYFRYEFEETYKVVTPKIITQNIELTNINTIPATFSYDIVVTPTTEEKHIGYVTNPQIEIIQTSNTNSLNNSIVKFPIRFMAESDFRIREKYSILVRQYVQSPESYNFYRILKQLGSLESILLENQPGLIHGNVYSVTNTEEKVVGFFDVSSVSEKRIFFNYFDFNFTKPFYPYLCQIDTLDYRDNTSADFDRNDRATMYNLLEVKTPPWELLDIIYEEALDDDGNIILVPIYILLTPECGNVTSFASNIKPEFWED